MKTKLRMYLWALVAAMTLAHSGYAADLIVEENGVLPNYATIQSAVTAANPGDRIFVKNKAGNVPYQENVTITKSLSILSYDPDGVYYVFGNYTLNPIANGEINIIGMYNQSGSVSAFAASTLTTPTRVNFHNNTLVSGSFSTNQLGWVAHVAGNHLMAGSITTRTATITGNQVEGSITVADVGGSVTGYAEDTLYIVGNRLASAAGAYGGSINWSNDDDYFMICNNWVRVQSHGINLSAFKAGSGVNRLDNNSIEVNASGSIYGVTFSTIPANATVSVNNNSVLDENTSSSWVQYAFNFGTVTAGSFVSLNYNVHRNFYSGGLTNASPTTVSQTGNAAGGTTFDNNNVTGVCASAECVNLGNPSTDHTDHDLSRNDVGVAGGSYNFANFWPNQTGGARVYLVKTPRTVVQSSTINAKADSYDR